MGFCKMAEWERIGQIDTQIDRQIDRIELDGLSNLIMP